MNISLLILLLASQTSQLVTTGSQTRFLLASDYGLAAKFEDWRVQNIDSSGEKGSSDINSRARSAGTSVQSDLGATLSADRSMVTYLIK